MHTHEHTVARVDGMVAEALMDDALDGQADHDWEFRVALASAARGFNAHAVAVAFAQTY